MQKNYRLFLLCLLSFSLLSIPVSAQDDKAAAVKSLNDFYFSVNVRSSDSLPGTDYGMIVWADEDRMYYFQADSWRASVHVRREEDDEWEQPVYGDDLILISPAEPAKLSVLQTQSQASFCVNDQLALVIDDIGDVFEDFGVAGSISGQGDPVNFEFDDFVVYGPEGP